jgi:serine/threonine protein kinase
LSRFEQEACAASGLNHPNIIAIAEICETETGRFIVMEFIDGASGSRVAYVTKVRMAARKAINNSESYRYLWRLAMKDEKHGSNPKVRSLQL